MHQVGGLCHTSLNNAQIGILGIQFIWTRDAEIALAHARQDKKIMGKVDQKFLDMLNELIDVTTQELTKINRTKFETLITIHLHQRDIFHDLVSIINVLTTSQLQAALLISSHFITGCTEGQVSS